MGGGTAQYLILKVVSEEETTEPCPNDANNSIYITTTTFNYSWQEIHDALNADTPVFFVRDVDGVTNWHLVNSAYVDSHNGYIINTNGGGAWHFDSPTAKVLVSENDFECGDGK